MSSKFNLTRAALVLGIAGLAAGLSMSQAAAFGGRMGGFGGGFGSHMGGGFGGRTGGFGGLSGVRTGGFNPGRVSIGHRGPIDIGRRVPPIRITNRIPIDNPCTLRHLGPTCGGPRLPPPPRLTCRFHPYLPGCRPWPPVVIRTPPIYVSPVVVGRAPVAVAAVAPAYSAVAPAVSAAPVCAVPGAPITIVFQPTATAGDITAFLTSYSAKLGNGPDKDGVYRMRLEDGTLTPDQYAQVIQSMRNQTNIVSAING